MNGSISKNNEDMQSFLSSSASIKKIVSWNDFLKLKQQEYAAREIKKIEEEEKRIAEEKARKEEEKRLKKEAEEKRKAEAKAKREAAKRAKEEAERKKREEEAKRIAKEQSTTYSIYIDKITDNLQAMMTSRATFGWSASDFRKNTSSLPFSVQDIVGKSNADEVSSKLNKGGFKSHIEEK